MKLTRFHLFDQKELFAYFDNKEWGREREERAGKIFIWQNVL